MQTIRYDILLMFIIALCTLTTRALPFVLFGGKKEPPKMILFLGNMLPTAVIAILIVYCLKSISFHSLSGFLPSMIAVAFTIFLHVWKRNNLVSIGLGTLCYMFLVQYIF